MSSERQPFVGSGSAVQGFDGVEHVSHEEHVRRKRKGRGPRRAMETPCRTAALILAVPICLAVVVYAGKALEAQRGIVSDGTPGGLVSPRLASLPYPPGYTLELVEAVTRHGARVPLTALPSSLEETWHCGSVTLAAETGLLRSEALVVPHRHRKRCAGMAHTGMMARRVRIGSRGVGAALPGNCSLGQLTDAGLRGMVGVGAVLRDHYVHRLKYLDPYMVTEGSGNAARNLMVRVRSTDTWRTRATAEALMRGLYPASARPRGEDGAVHVEYLTVQEETAYPNARRCPRLRKTVSRLAAQRRESKEAVMGQPGAVAFTRAEEALRKLFSPAQPPSVQSMASILECRDAEGFQLPRGVDADLATDLAVAAGAELNATVSDREYLALGIGEFFHELAEGMFERVSGAEMPRMLYYSAHDTTLASLLGVFGAFDARWPPFGSQLLLELFRRDDGQTHHFRVVYNGVALTPKGCGDTFCDIQVLRDLVKHYSQSEVGVHCAGVEPNVMLGVV